MDNTRREVLNEYCNHYFEDIRIDVLQMRPPAVVFFVEKSEIQRDAFLQHGNQSAQESC